jgi:tRNA(adenine34) deaminase
MRNREAPSRAEIDQRMMARCVELGTEAAKRGEYPFGSLIAFGNEIIAEAANHAKREKDESRHAEIIAIA